jgi:hypothetical protein
MLFASLLVLAASEKCLLSQAGVYDLGSRTFSFFTDITTVVAKGLQLEATKLVGSEKSKMISAQYDIALIEYEKLQNAASPYVSKVTTVAMENWDKATAAMYPYVDLVNAKLDAPLKEFVLRLPAHKELLTAPSLVDKILLLSWLVCALTFALRVLSFVLSLTLGIFFRTLCFPCRLCSKRGEASAKKKTFAGKSQASNGNGKTAPPPKKKA